MRPVQHGFGEADAGLLSGGQHAAFHVAETDQVEARKRLLDAPAETLHAVNEAENAEVLRHSQVAGKLRVDGREVGALERLGSGEGQVDAFDENGARAGLEDAENHVDGGSLPRAVGTQQPDDLITGHVEGDAIHRHGIAEALAEAGNREHATGGGRLRHYSIVTQLQYHQRDERTS